MMPGKENVRVCSLERRRLSFFIACLTLLTVLHGCSGQSAGGEATLEVRVPPSVRTLNVSIDPITPSGQLRQEQITVDSEGPARLTLPAGDYALEIVARDDRQTITGIARSRHKLSPGQTAVAEILSQPTAVEIPADVPGSQQVVQSRPGPPPNIVLIVLDDLDYTQVGVFGKSYSSVDVRTLTPRMDRLASEGVRFTQFYSSGAKCSPTRASILTSRHPAHFGWRDVVDVYYRSDLTRAAPARSLPWTTTTVAEVLQGAGYATCHIGKWHVGYSRPSARPQEQGFSRAIVWRPVGWDGVTGDGGYWGYRLVYTGEGPTSSVVTPRLGQPGADADYLNRRLTDEAISFVTTHQTGPFFLNVMHLTPHHPEHVPPGFDNSAPGYDLATNPGKTSAMITDVDREIGRLVDHIDQLGLGARTLVIVTSDNGGAYPTDRTVEIRGRKSRVYEGGIRVPFIARWLGTIPADTLNLSQTSTVDLLPTLADCAGATIPGGIEGRSLYEHMTTGRRDNGKDLFWLAPRFTRYSDARAVGADYDLMELDQFAVRWWKYKLVRTAGTDELYDLSTGTRGEFNDISASNPAVVADLKARYKAWRKSVGVIAYRTSLVGSIWQVLFDPRIDFVDADFTFSLDIQTTDLQQDSILATREGCWELAFRQGKVTLKLYDDRPGILLSQREVTLESPVLQAGRTTNVAFTVYGHLTDNHIPSLYIDRQLVARILPDQYPAGSALYAVPTNNAPIILGSRSDGSGRFQGTIARPKLNTLALYPDEL